MPSPSTSATDHFHRYYTQGTLTPEEISSVPSLDFTALRISGAKYDDAKMSLSSESSRGPVTLARGISHQAFLKYCTTDPKPPVRIPMLAAR